MPTAAITTWNNKKLEPYYRPDEAVLVHVKLPASVNYDRGTCLGEITATPGTFGAYATGNSDGTETLRAILPYDVSTDASGNITYVNTNGVAGGEFGQTHLTVPVYIRGFFHTADLVGLDAAGIADASARLVHGTASDGVLGLGV
jgi:hypothetical protein